LYLRIVNVILYYLVLVSIIILLAYEEVLI